MGLFDFFKKRIYSKDAVKRNFISVYKTKFRALQGSGAHHLVIKTYAMAETLKDWCKYNGEPYIDEKINFELMPFAMMNQDVSLDIFCEYLIFRTGMDDYDLMLLKKHINDVMVDCLNNNPKYISQLRSQESFNFAWYNLLDNAIRKQIFYS